MAYHLSIFVENKPGKLERITKILADNRVNLRAISVASAGEFGVVKILVNDPEKTYTVLKEQKLTVSKRPIVIALVNDEPGGLHNLLVTLSSHSVNIEDCYGFVLGDKKSAAIVVEVDRPDDAARILNENGIRTLPEEQIYSI